MAARVKTLRRTPWVKPAGNLYLEVTVPVQVRSELNRRDHWTAIRSTKHARFVEQHRAVVACCHGLSDVFAVFRWQLGVGCEVVVTLTKLGGQRLDSGNLGAAFKQVQDTVARLLQVDDGHAGIRWEYEQSPGGEVGVRISFDVQWGEGA